MTGTPSRGFDEKAYLAAKQLKPGEDPYRQHAFNQLESDKLSPDRPIRDTRHTGVASVVLVEKERWREAPTPVGFSLSHMGLRNEENFLRLSPAPETYKPFLSVVFLAPLSFIDLLRV